MITTDSPNRFNLIIYTAIWVIVGVVQGLVLHFVYDIDSFNAMADSLIFQARHYLIKKPSYRLT